MKTLLLPLLVTAAHAVGMIYPLYTYPSSHVYTYINVSSASLLFPVVVILNPDNGQPVCPMNSDWVRGLRQIAEYKKLGGRITTIGYVSTDYTNVPASVVKGHVDTYFQCWNVTGIFFDEAENDASHLEYYKDLYDYVKGKSMAETTVVLNPGCTTDESYMTACDINVLFESPPSDWARHKMPAWAANYPANRLAMIVHSVSTADAMRSVLANATAKGFGFVLSTDNEYTKLPNYWKEEVEFLASYQTSETDESSAKHSHQHHDDPSSGLASAVGRATVSQSAIALLFAALLVL